MLSEVRRLLEETDDRGISPVPFSKVADDSPPSLSSARHHQHVHQQHLHHRYTDPTTPLYGGAAGRPVIGESGASPIPLSSPSRRQSSLSPNAAGYNFQQMITSHTTSNTTAAEQRPSSRSVTAESPASQKKSAAMNSVSDLEEEIKIVEMIFTTLSSSLAYYEHGATSSLASTYSPSGEIATPSDAKNFISHFNAVITYAVAHSGLQERASTFGAHGAFSAEAALVRLVFDCPYDVIQILTNLVQSAYRSAFVPPRSGHHIPLQEEHKNLTGAQNLSGKWNHNRATTTSGGFQASSVVSVAEEFVALRLAAIDALKQLLNVAIEASTRKRPSAASVAISGAKKTTSLSVLDMLQTSFSRCGTIKVLLDVVLLPTAPEVLRVAAVETIFVFTIRCVPTASHSNDDSVRNQKNNNDTPAQLKNSALQSLLTTSFDALLKAAAMDASDKVRCYSAAIIRQLISLFPRHSQVVKSVPVLLRLMAQETQLDVVALCAASIDMIVRRAALELDHAAVTGGIQNVVDTSCQLLEKSCGSFPVVLRLQPAASSYVNDQHQYSSSILKHSATSEEDDQQFDVLESLAGLLHACVLFALSAVSADLQSVFRGMLMQGAVPRLAKICRVQHIGCARVSAACLSLMVLRAPPSFAIPLALAEPKAAVHIVHSVVSKSMPAGPISLEEDEALRQSTALFLFDIAVSVAASIVFSPLARAHWRKLLSELPTWETPFVQRLSGTLSSAELSLFTDMIIQDECGVSLNDVAAVDWDDDAHPSPHSIQCLLDAQEVRRTAKNGSSLVASLSHWRSVEQARRRPDTKRGYLCFVVFGYAFLVLGDPVPIGPTVVTLEAGAWSKQGRGESLQDLRANEREEIGDKALFTQHETVEQQQRNVTGHQNNNLYRPLFPHVGSPAPSNNEQQSRSTPQQRHAPRTTHPATMPTATATVAPPSRREAAAAASSRAVPQQPQDDAYRHLYKEFQAALELTIFLSTHYHRNRLTPGEITGNIRGPAAPPSVVSRVVSNKTNPYANKAPIANGDRAQQMRAWTSSVVEEGDLFFFYIPLSALSVNVVEAVIGKARKHQTVAKKNFLITPQNQKERRWFLLDMHTAIMPKLIVLLQSLKKLIAVHTEESVRNALQVLPSIHMRRGNGIPPAGSAVNDTAMLEGQNNNNNKIVDKAITCSNLRSVCDFALQTFSIRMTSSAVDDIIGSFAGAGGNGSGGMMASSFFAPLFPPNAQNSAFLVEAEGGGGGSGHQHQHQQQLFQVSSRGNSSSAPSAYDDDDDIDEMALFQEAPPPQRQQHVRSDAVTSAAASGAYSIRRLSTIGGKPAAAVGGGNRPTTVVAATAYGEENDDDDDSFELMKL